MMKKKILATLALAAITAAPAHAISEKYRQQLIRSGCTQVTEANGTCDIHKTKAQNQAYAPKAPTSPKLTEKQNVGEVRGQAEDVLGMKIAAATSYLLDHGWSEPKNNEWMKYGHTLRLMPENGVVVNAQLIK